MALNAGEDKDMRIQSASIGLDNSPENPSSEQERTRIHDPNPGGSKSRVASPMVRYHECQKNHAANIGGNVTDGCGEFMPSGDEGTLEALMCAACSCHRNFHRKEHHSGEGGAGMVHPLHLPPPLPSPLVSLHRGGSSHWSPMVQPVKMAFVGGGSVGTDSSSEELNFNSLQVAPPPPHFLSKKRFRTKFTPDQKEKMMEFAEKLGWRIPREDDSEMQRFCAEVGVKRQVFKVWMHNNKINSSKKNSQEI
ncbi:ZF-HD homeobox protein-like [Dorcoceras hygrometricum]|uniref:ZF-HD homeobox protein-like n=1 Tax=Dorcoceras hygrometricum TaxID=472368 RepID=A0A2Z7A9N5_9LAMI|nr:ZF-HD homeobox protein-like [Dorcoceras hygrometricum]